MAGETRFSIDNIDLGPDDLPAQLPKAGRLLAVRPGPDRPDYCVGVLDEAIWYRTTVDALRDGGVDLAAADPDMIRVGEDGSVLLQVFGVIFAARIAGEAPHPGMRNFPVALAYVFDNTLLRDERIDFAKVIYAAVAFVTNVTEPAPTPAPADSV